MRWGRACWVSAVVLIGLSVCVVLLEQIPGMFVKPIVCWALAGLITGAGVGWFVRELSWAGRLIGSAVLVVLWVAIVMVVWSQIVGYKAFRDALEYGGGMESIILAAALTVISLFVGASLISLVARER